MTDTPLSEIDGGTPDAIEDASPTSLSVPSGGASNQPEGTLDSLAICANMLERFSPELFPPNADGQVHFARVMMDSTAGEIRAYLAALASSRAEGEGLPKLTKAMIRAACMAHYGDDNIEGIDLTADGHNYSFEQGFRRMWKAICALPRHHDSGVVGSPVQPEGEGERDLRERLLRDLNRLPAPDYWDGSWEQAIAHAQNVVEGRMPPQPEGVKR